MPKTCSKCGVEQSETRFYVRPNGNYHSWCIACMKALRVERERGGASRQRKELANESERAAMCKCDSCSRQAWSEGYCKWHHPDFQREYRRAYPERVKRSSLKRDYGISLELYQRILVEQGGVCAICGVQSGTERANNGEYKALGVDHDHKTGAVRGLLCQMCNQGIGALRDNAVLLRRAAEYLEHYEKNVRSEERRKTGDELLDELMNMK